MDDLTLEQIGEAIRTVAMAHDGFGGNCAAFARVLDRVLCGEGDYVIIDHGHYEFAAHVGLRYRGMILDADGVSTREDWIARWADDDEDEDEAADRDADRGFGEFHDPDGTHVLALADPDGGFSARLDAQSLEADLRCFLEQARLGPVPGCHVRTPSSTA